MKQLEPTLDWSQYCWQNIVAVWTVMHTLTGIWTELRSQLGSGDWRPQCVTQIILILKLFNNPSRPVWMHVYSLHFLIYSGVSSHLSPARTFAASPWCLSSCWTRHFPIWALRRSTPALHKWDAAGRFKAALALLTACLLQLSASWGSLTPVISVAAVFSQFPLAGLILPSQARRERSDNWLDHWVV